jgi:sporulation protein YlmC with PRC-barrel domain
MTKFRGALSCSTLTGDAVRNAAGEDLGEIEDIMIDLDTGRIAYAVLSFGGILGMGDKLFAIPWEALQLAQEEHKFILNVSKDMLEKAPGFDKDHWPDTSDPEWNTKTRDYWRKAV